MHKTFLVVIVFSLFTAACGESGISTPAATATPSAVPTMSPPTLIKEIELETQTGTSYTLDWSPDGKTLAVASGYEVTLLSHDLNANPTVLKPPGGALAVTWSPDQTQFATVNGYQDQTVRLWDWDHASSQLMLAQEFQTGSDQYAVFWSPDGKQLATLADDDKSAFQIWDTSTWQEIRRFDLPYTLPRRTLSWSADSSVLYGAGELNGQVVIFALNITDGSAQEVAKFPLAAVEVLAFSPDARKLAIADAQGVVAIHDLAADKALTGFKSVDQPVDLDWSPDGSTLAILAYKTRLQLWDVSN